MPSGIVLNLKCRNCGIVYTWEPPYATFTSPVEDFDVNEVDPNAAHRFPQCPECTSWATLVISQVGP